MLDFLILAAIVVVGYLVIHHTLEIFTTRKRGEEINERDKDEKKL